MTAFAAIALVAIALLSLEGHSGTAVGLAIGIAGFAGLLDLSFFLRSRGRRSLLLAPRRYLDRIVRAQWLGLLILGCAVAEVLRATGTDPLASDTNAAQAVIAALAVGITTIYASSLTDWYWVLPKVSGIVAPPPCTSVVAKTYAGVTKIWFFHRAVATAVITALIAGTPAYVAGTVTDSASLRAVLTVLGAAAAIGFNAATAGTVWAFQQFLSPSLEVGSYVRKRKDVDDRDPQDGYVLDVSVQGIKVKLESDVTGRFVRDGDLVRYHQAETLTKGSRLEAMCPSLHECRAVNWYCLRNRNANTPYAPSEEEPAALPADAAGL